MKVVSTYNLDGIEFECVYYDDSMFRNQILTICPAAGNTLLRQESVATPSLQTTVPISSPSCKRFAAKTVDGT